MTGLASHPDDVLPSVSVVVPLLNEAEAVERCVRTFDVQDYPPELLEVVIVDGGSTDGSRERVRQLSVERPWLRIVDNPHRRASSAFNRGIEASTGEVICLVGAHSEVGRDYLRRSVMALSESGAGGVGGQLLHRGTDPASRAIGLAMVSKFGMASPFRFADNRRLVDTIGHPAYRRDAVVDTGPFDESLNRNSDYEFNYRMRHRGYVLLFDPEIVTSYHPRGSLVELGRQFFHYGVGKGRVLRRHPLSVQARHLIPPAFAAFILAAPALTACRAGRRLVGAVAAAYLAGLTLAAATDKPWRDGASTAIFVAAFPTMHLSWGTGLLWSAITGPAVGR